MKNHRAKQWLAALICAAFLNADVQRARSQGVLAPLCIIILIGTGAAIGLVVISSCRPKYRCYSKGEKQTATNACLVITVRCAEIDGWTLGGTNTWRKVADCIAWCCPGRTNTPSFDDPQPVPSSGYAIIEKSTDGGKTWTANQMTVNADGYYEFSERSTNASAMYRAFSNEETP